MKFSSSALAVLALWSQRSHAQSAVSLTASSELTFVEGTRTDKVTMQTGPPTGPYSTYTGRITLDLSSDSDGDAFSTTFTGELPGGSGTESITGTPTASSSGTESGSGTSTESSSKPTNTQPCNNYVELCSRKYSNWTMVSCHNSPFVRPGNSASNQELPVDVQLNDGVRMVQAQIQWPTDGTTPHFCHTSCDLLDAGPITDWLTKVRQWVEKHPYDVITILLGNGNYSDPSLYAPFIQETGILKYAYEPPYLPMELDDWPTLEELIIRGKRVVMFMDYKADQKKYPWLIDQFSHIWESPFDPVDRKFPCTPQRPPNLSNNGAKKRMSFINHNLNAQFNVFGTEILVPAVSLLNETNANNGTGSLGLTANNCRAKWGRAPNILNVDYYNYGNFPGSVFDVAAKMNNVTYKRGSCCGTVSSAWQLGKPAPWTLFMAAFFSAYLMF